MSLEEYWAYRLAPIPRSGNWEPPPLAHNRDQAEKMRADEISVLEQWTDPTAIQQRRRRFEIWEAVCNARTRTAAENACRLWAAFDPESTFPALLLSMIPQWLAVTRDRRFPKSRTANDTRLAYLSAGMAGACMGISPLTAFHRIRTIKHETGGPLWNDNANRCECWRCDRDREMQAFDAVVDLAHRERP
jgi:hypothetical protein